MNASNELIKRLENSEEPKQMISVLDDVSLQKYLALTSDETLDQHLHHWLAHFFDEKQRFPNGSTIGSRRFQEILGKLSNYARYTKASTPTYISAVTC